MALIRDRLTRLELSNIELRELAGWPDSLIEDYLGIEENFLTLADIIQPEITRKVGDPGEPAFEVNWSNLGGIWETAGFYINLDRVYLEGTVTHTTGGIGTTIFILPEGYRPSNQIAFSVDGNSSYAKVSITNAGLVNLSIGSASSNLHLDGISFRI